MPKTIWNFNGLLTSFPQKHGQFPIKIPAHIGLMSCSRNHTAPFALLVHVGVEETGNLQVKGRM